MKERIKAELVPQYGARFKSWVYPLPGMRADELPVTNPVAQIRIRETYEGYTAHLETGFGPLATLDLFRFEHWSEVDGKLSEVMARLRTVVMGLQRAELEPPRTVVGLTLAQERERRGRAGYEWPAQHVLKFVPSTVSSRICMVCHEGQSELECELPSYIDHGSVVGLHERCKERLPGALANTRN